MINNLECNLIKYSYSSDTKMFFSLRFVQANFKYLVLKENQQFILWSA